MSTQMQNPDLQMPTGLCPDGQRAYKAIYGFLKRKKRTFTGGCKAFYSPQEWAQRERWGEGSVLIVVHDGGDLAPCFNSDYQNFTAWKGMENILEDAGFWAQPITCWATAIYKKENK